MGDNMNIHKWQCCISVRWKLSYPVAEELFMRVYLGNVLLRLHTLGIERKHEICY